MKKFIELTDNINIKVQVNIDFIIKFYEFENSNGKFTMVQTMSNYGNEIKVQESVKEILNLINN
jgi:regulation of enolase protein 1 (concanavalin A-like superfamily)